VTRNPEIPGSSDEAEGTMQSQSIAGSTNTAESPDETPISTEKQSQETDNSEEDSQ